MKNNDKRQLDNNFIEQKVAEAFGYSDEQLAEELRRKGNLSGSGAGWNGDMIKAVIRAAG